MCRAQETKPFWNAAVHHWSVSSISTPAFYQLRYGKTHMQLSDIKHSTLKGEEDFTDSHILNLVLNGCSTLIWHSVNAKENWFVSQGKKTFTSLSNHKKKTPSIPQTYIIKAQTEINLHDKISQNFKKIPLGALKIWKPTRTCSAHFIFMDYLWSGVPQHTSEARAWHQYKGLKRGWFQSLAPQDLHFRVWQFTVCKTTEDLTAASHTESALRNVM